jgi:hypothetical protein
VGAALKRVFSEGLVKREDLFIQTKWACAVDLLRAVSVSVSADWVGSHR